MITETVHSQLHDNEVMAGTLVQVKDLDQTSVLQALHCVELNLHSFLPRQTLGNPLGSQLLAGTFLNAALDR